MDFRLKHPYGLSATQRVGGLRSSFDTPLTTFEFFLYGIEFGVPVVSVGEVYECAAADEDFFIKLFAEFPARLPVM